MRKITSLLFLFSFFFLLPAVAGICAGTMSYCESLCNIYKETIRHMEVISNEMAHLGECISAGFSGWPCSFQRIVHPFDVL